MKVDFIILGAMKAGTSTLYEILKNHPEISFCKEKEPHFFSITTDWRNETEKYHKLFNKEKGKIYGEASTSYSLYPECNLNIWHDIYAYNKKMKFIYIVHNPIDRVVSHYMQYYLKRQI